jgi:hydroxypyruvate isomerase
MSPAGMRFAANTLTIFKDLDPLSQMMAFKKCGFDYIEFLFPYLAPVNKVKGLLDGFNLRISLIDVLPGDVRNLDISAAIDPARVDEFRNYARLALQYATVLDVHYVNCLSGCVPAVKGGNRAAMLELYKENLAFTCDLFKDSGKTILLEPVSEFQFKGYLTGDLHEAVRIIEELNRPNLALQFDVFHMQLLHGNLAGNIRKYFDHIKYIQVADAPDRHQPGTGEINFPYLFGLLKELGYKGFIGLEYIPNGPPEQWFSWMQALG